MVKCCDCRFWDGMYCRVHAPVVICTMPGQQYPETHWPETKAGDLCGEGISKGSMEKSYESTLRSGDRRE